MTKNKKRRLNKRRPNFKYKESERSSWSAGNRLYSATRAKQAAEDEIKEYAALAQ